MCQDFNQQIIAVDQIAKSKENYKKSKLLQMKLVLKIETELSASYFITSGKSCPIEKVLGNCL